MTSVVPSWVTIDATSGTLSILAPEVATDTEFNFNINVVISGISGSVQKLIKLTILNCIPVNCQKCLNTNSSTCEVCMSGYDLISGQCQAQIIESETAKALSKTSTLLLIAITAMVAITSLINLSSLATLWMTINQQQLFFII